MLRVKYERLARGWDQHQTAAVARIHQPTLSLIERGRFIPTPDQLDRLARAFNVSASELLKPVRVVETEQPMEQSA